MIMVVFGSMAFGQLYTGWSNFQDYTMNPSATGITTNQVNFPVLIRLTSANSAIFNSTNFPNTPNDLRFAKGGNLNVGYAYQVERWDATDNLAEIWVLVDTVFSASTSQGIRMYWGNAGVAAASSGSAVFSPSNGFAAVWHLQDLTDATGNGNTLNTNNAASKVSGVVDSGYSFNGTISQHLNCTGVMGSPAALTISCWATTSVTTQADFVSISNDAALESNANGANCMFYENASNSWPSFNNTASSVLSGKGWTYVTGVINPSASFEGYYQNGALVTGLGSNNSCGTSGVAIEYVQTPNTTGLGYNPYNHRYFNGSLNEVRIENVARSADWINLCFANQNVGQTFIQPNPLPSAPALSSPSNGAVSQPVVLTLAWGSVAAATAYEAQVSTNSAFSTTAYDQPGITGTSQLAVTGLANSATYYWRANATNSVGTGTWSGAWSFTTIAPWSAPLLTSPTNGAAGQALSPVLLWSAVSGAASYTLQVSQNTAFSTFVVNQAGLTALSQAVGPLSYATTYFWRVNAYDGTSLTSAWSSAWSFVTTLPLPGTPILSSPASGAASVPTSVTLAWGQVLLATSYQLQISASSAFATTFLSQSGVTGVSVSVSNLALGTTYYWQVAGASTVGQGPWSAIWSFSTVTTAVVTTGEQKIEKADFSVAGGMVSYVVGAPGPVEIRFIDILGRSALVLNRTQSVGRYAIELKNCNLAAGQYIVHFKAAGIEKRASVMITR